MPPSALSRRLPISLDQISRLQQCSAGFLSGIKHIEVGVPGAIALRVRFDVAAFSPLLFDRFGVERPTHLSGAVDKRQAEYLAGRCLAGLAMQHLGGKSGSLPVGQDHAPDWPVGFAGSISHCDGHCVCLVTDQPRTTCGIDIERFADDTCLNGILHQALLWMERRFLMNFLNSDVTRTATLFFSAKETLFKALYPIVKRYFDFEDACVCQLEEEKLTVELMRDLHWSLPIGTVFTIGFKYCTDHVLTWLSYVEPFGRQVADTRSNR